MNCLIALSLSSLSDNILLLLSLLVFIALLLSKIGFRFGMPLMVLFLALGMFAGEDGLGLTFDNYNVAYSSGQIAMSIILLTGGLETNFKVIKPILVQGSLLATLGVLLTALFTGMFIYYVFGWNFTFRPVISCLLFGAVMASTDSAAVFSILRGKGTGLKGRLSPLLELESGGNDPMAYILTILFVQILVSSVDGGGETRASVLIGQASLSLLLQLGFGILVGFGMGYLSKYLLRKVQLNGSPLYAIMILSIGLFTNALSSMIGGNGLLALYIAAVIMGNDKKLPYRKDVLKFLDGITWLVQLLMFLMLGLLVNPSELPPIILPAMLVGAFMMLVARPASVFLCLAPFRNVSFREKAMISWVGLKGAGPILFAMAPVVAGVSKSGQIFNCVFVITLMSLLLQGMTIPAASKILRVYKPDEKEPDTLGLEVPDEMGHLTGHTLTKNDLEHGATLKDMNMPQGTRVIMLKREADYIVPTGKLTLKEGDKMVILVSEEDKEENQEPISE